MNTEIRDKFKKLYYEKFGISLTNEEATQMSTDLINLVKVLLKPDKPEVLVTSSLERRQHETYPAEQYP